MHEKYMTVSRGRLLGDKIERLSVVSTTYKLDKARIRQKQLEGIECNSRSAVWGDDDANFDLALEQFGVDVDKIHDTPTCPERIFNCWLEDWEVNCIKDRGAAAKHKLVNKYGGLVFTDDADGKTQYTILETNMYWKPYRGGGWCILGEPAEYDGTNDDVLTPFVINNECLIPLIEMEDQPPLKNIKKVQNTKETLDTDNSPNSV